MEIIAHSFDSRLFPGVLIQTNGETRVTSLLKSKTDITLHQGVSKDVKEFPGLKVSDSLNVIFPGTSRYKWLKIVPT